MTLRWIGARARDLDHVLRALKLERLPEEDPDEAALAGVQLPSGWVIVVARDGDLSVREAASILAAHHEVVTVEVFGPEHAVVAGFADDRPPWTVTHDGTQRRTHLETTGTPPIEFSGIRAWHEHDQRAKGGDDAEVNCMIEIPLDLAKRLVGYRHDEEALGASSWTWHALTPQPVTAPEPVPVPAATPAPRPAPAPRPQPRPPRPTPAPPAPAPPPPPPVPVPELPYEREERRHERQELRMSRRALRRARRRQSRKGFWANLGGWFIDMLEAMGEADTSQDPEIEEHRRRIRLLARSRERRRRRKRERERRKREANE